MEALKRIALQQQLNVATLMCVYVVQIVLKIL